MDLRTELLLILHAEPDSDPLARVSKDFLNRKFPEDQVILAWVQGLVDTNTGLRKLILEQTAKIDHLLTSLKLKLEEKDRASK